MGGLGEHSRAPGLTWQEVEGTAGRGAGLAQEPGELWAGALFIFLSLPGPPRLPHVQGSC